MAVILPQSIQSDLQSSLPIIPNNGNPGGAYNMAPAEEGKPTQAPVDPYAWLKPSPYMEQVKKVLAQQDALLENTVFELTNPQEKQMFNVVPTRAGLDIQPLNDYALPVTYGQDDPRLITYPLDVGLDSSPQYLPILPGE